MGKVAEMEQLRKEMMQDLMMQEIMEYHIPIRENPLSTVSKEFAKSTQVGGTHYQLPIQPIEYITKNNLGYIEGNVVKYVTRHKSKNGAEDIKKAIHYLQMLLDTYETK